MNLKFLLKLTIAFLFASLLFLTSESAQAHPGRTDGSGGHTCRTNCDKWGVGYGEYHYHNGGSRGLDLETRLEILRAETCLEHKKNLEENIKNGKDIFYRFKRNKNKLINIHKSEIIDKRMTRILLNFDKLIIKDLKSNPFFNIKYFYNQILFLTQRIINNPEKFLKKILSFLSY